MAIPIVPLRNLSTEDVLYGDRNTSYRWEVLRHPRVRRNLALNPWPVAGGATSDYISRWGWGLSVTTGAAIFTCTSTQDSAGRGFDVRGNLDVTPGTTGDWVSLPVRKGQKICASANVKSNKALILFVAIRVHNGAGTWITGSYNGDALTLTPNVYSRVIGSFTSPYDGYITISFRVAGGPTLVSGDTISTQMLLIEPDTLNYEGYFDGGSNKAAYYTGTPNASTSFMVPMQDELLGTLDGVSDGSLAWTQNASVKGGGNISVIDLDEASPGMMDISDLQLESVRIRPVCLIEGLPENPLGTFLVSSAKEDWNDTGRLWKLELLDRCTVPQQDSVDASYAVPAGALILQTVRTILATSGEFIVIDEAATLATSSGMVWEAGTSKLTIINDLLNVAGYNALWIDGSGNFQATVRVLPANRSLYYEVLGIPRELRDGEKAIYRSDWNRDRDSFHVPNKVIAVQASGGEDAPALVGVWTNEDPLSPYSLQARGRWIPHVIDSVDCPAGSPESITTFLQKRAQTTLIQMSAVQAQVKVEHLPIPVRVSDVMRFSHTEAGVDARHVITRIELGAYPLGLMKTTLQEVISL